MHLVTVLKRAAAAAVPVAAANVFFRALEHRMGLQAAALSYLRS